MGNQSKVKAVLSQFPLEIKEAVILNDKDKKASWLVSTSSGPKVLKKSPAEKERLLFLLQATKYLQKKGVRIPKMVLTSAGADFAEDDEGRGYILSDFVPGTSPKRYTAVELASIMRQLGKFHRASRGFQPQAELRERRHLGRWSNAYQKQLDHLELFKALAKLDRSEFSKLYMRHVNRYILQGKRAMAIIEGGSYKRWVNKVAEQGNLCHQDFAAGNLIKSTRGYYVIDMDSVTIDLPARDIRKIFNKVMKKTGWSGLKAAAMLRAYHKSHPLTADQCRVIYADLLFPHLFYGMASKYFHERLEWDQTETLDKFKDMLRKDRSRLRMLAAWKRIVKRALR